MTNPTGHVKHIFFKCYFGAIRKGLTQYPHSVKDTCCDLARGVGIQVAVSAILGAQAPSIRSGRDYTMLSRNNDIDGVGDKFTRICFQSLY